MRLLSIISVGLLLAMFLPGGPAQAAGSIIPPVSGGGRVSYCRPERGRHGSGGGR